MKFDDLMADHSIDAVRKTTWSRRNTLFLPPVVDGSRGIWCRLVGYDGNEEGVDVEYPMVVTACRDDSDDWQACEPHTEAVEHDTAKRNK